MRKDIKMLNVYIKNTEMKGKFCLNKIEKIFQLNTEFRKQGNFGSWSECGHRLFL